MNVLLVVLAFWLPGAVFGAAPACAAGRSPRQRRS